MKVVINKCYGGFSVSPEACLWLYEHGYDGEGFKTPINEYYPEGEKPFSETFSKESQLKKWREYLNGGIDSFFLTIFSPDEKFVLSSRDFERHDPLLVQCVEELGKKADGSCAKLRVVNIPNGVDYFIDEYDGIESIHEQHRSWD